MNFRELTVDAYSRLHDLIASRVEPPLVPFLGYKYPEGKPDFIYDLQERDFTRELVNAFNQYAYWVERVGLWEDILCGYSEDEALELRFEFTTLLLDYCLSFPQKFKSRIIFCATQLCYTKGIAEKLISKECVRSHEKIDMSALVAIANHWSSCVKLVAVLRDVDAKQYRESTANYRNKAQHQHPQRLDYGHTANVVRSFPPGYSVSYAFGESPPLATSDVLPSLIEEAAKMQIAFFVYRDLVGEHTGIKRET
jgi:hypothetical protein